MRRTPALALLVSLLALVGLLTGCGDDGGDDSADTTAAPTTQTTEEPEVFDPEDYGVGGDDAQADDDGDPADEPDDDDSSSGCSVDPEETNEATIIGDLVDCVLPDLADDVTGASFEESGGGAAAFVSGDLDVTEALQVCEVVTAFIEAELTEYDEVVLTISTDSDVVGETGIPLVIAEDGDGSCEPA